MKIQKISLIVAIIAMVQVNNAQVFEWAKKMGGTNYDMGHSIAVDASGNVYTIGQFQGIADFDPGAGTANLTSSGSNDIFISKLDASGNFVWVKQFAGTSSNVGTSIAVDALGNVYTTGYFNGTANFDPGAGTANLTSAGFTDAFISKLDASGNFVWVKQFTGTSSIYGFSIAVDASENVYTTGYFFQTADFDPGPGTFNLTSAGYDDVFISKLDASGNFVWVKQFGDIYNDRGTSIAVDASGNVYTAGSFYETIDFDPGAGVFNLTSSGYADFFISKLDASGNFVWAKKMGGSSSETEISIAIDASENVYCTGRFQGTINVNSGPGITNLTSNGAFDIFISKFNALGTFVWARKIGGSSNEIGTSIAVDASNVYITGYFNGTVDFDPGSGTFNLTSTSSNRDIFVHKMRSCNNNTGTDIQTACDTYTWIDGNTYSANNNTATYMLTNAAGCDSLVTLNLTLNNSTSGTDVQNACDSYTWIDGNTYTESNNTATHTLTNAVGCDSVVTLNLTINNNTGIDAQIACDSFTWIDGNTYNTSNNTATHTLTNAAGCDSLVTLNLTLNNSTSGTDVQNACDSYTWIDGNTYTESNNTATHTLTNAVGCDSLITLNLTLNNSTFGTDVQNACDFFTWIDGNTYNTSNNTATHMLTNVAGCDSLVTLNLTINNNTGIDVQTACESYTWIDGNTYFSSNNTATHTLTNVAGCDSVVTLNLTVGISDLSTSISGITITANNNTATYQWLDCNDGNTPISGETDQSFTPTANGSYAVELTDNGCVDTSLCVNITTVGFIENSFDNPFSVYPNPTSGKLHVIFENELNNLQLIVRNTLGQEVYHNNYENASQIVIKLEIPVGIYFVEIASDNKKAVFKVIKE